MGHSHTLGRMRGEVRKARSERPIAGSMVRRATFSPRTSRMRIRGGGRQKRLCGAILRSVKGAMPGWMDGWMGMRGGVVI